MAEKPYGQFAPLYDLFHAAKEYGAEARFIRKVCDSLLDSRAQQLQLLDLACGTGSHAIAFSRLQCTVTAVDGSAAMLKIAQKKAKASNQRILFRRQDLTERTKEQGFDVVTCLFDSLGYLRTDTRIRAALRQAFKALRPGGVFVAEVWHQVTMVAGFDPIRVRRVATDTVQAVRIGETRLRSGNLAEVNYEFFYRKKGRAWKQFQEKHVNRFFTRGQITALLETAGFHVHKVLGGFTGDAPADDSAWHLVIVARRAE